MICYLLLAVGNMVLSAQMLKWFGFGPTTLVGVLWWLYWCTVAAMLKIHLLRVMFQRAPLEYEMEQAEKRYWMINAQFCTELDDAQRELLDIQLTEADKAWALAEARLAALDTPLNVRARRWQNWVCAFLPGPRLPAAV